MGSIWGTEKAFLDLPRFPTYEVWRRLRKWESVSLPCNRRSPHSYNFLTQDGERPGAIAEKAKVQVLNYESVEFLRDTASKGRKTAEGFFITTQSGKEFMAKKLVFATGVRDIMPDIEGFAECWGISAVHCPYCHGYELRGKKTGIMANGERAFHLASLVHNLTDDLCIITSGKAEFEHQQLEKFREHKIEIIEPEVREIVHSEGHIKNLVFTDGSERAFEGIYAGLPFEQHSDLPASLGCEITEHGYIKVDDFRRTSVEGIYARGDNSHMMRSIANAVSSGNLTGAIVNKELADDQF